MNQSNKDMNTRMHPNHSSVTDASGDPGGILASFYKRILLELNIKDQRLRQIIDRYVRRVNVGQNLSTESLSSIRGNTRKELFKNTMTWRKFLMGLRVINVKKIEISIKLTHQNDKETLHDLVVLLEDDLDNG